MHPNLVNSTRSVIVIHPYVQARLRVLSRREEPAGILLGTVSADAIHITGFKRAPAHALSQAASAAGSSLVGFYRLFSAQAPAPTAEEELLLAAANAEHSALWLLIHSTSGLAHEAIAWIREPNGAITTESVPLDTAPPPPVFEAPLLPAPPPAIEPSVPPVPPPPSSSRWAFVSVALLTAAIVSAVLYGLQFLPLHPEPVLTPPTLTLDLRSRGSELAASWDLGPTPMRPQSAYLIVREGKRERVTDLTASFTRQGSIVVSPATPDVVVTLQINFADAPSLSRSATYLGFAPPPPVKPPEPPPTAMHPDAEVEMLRRRNKELEDANAALRRHLRE